MKRESKFRDNGAIGALLDEYEKAIKELKTTIRDITRDELIEIVDHDTKDEDCRSIQTILTHVVKAGYTYVIAIRKWKGEQLNYTTKKQLFSIDEYIVALNEMFAYNEELFNDYPNIKIEEHNSANKVQVSWGQKYDVEQLFEHAIVHILRHRRQIERFLEKIENNKSN